MSCQNRKLMRCFAVTLLFGLVACGNKDASAPGSSPEQGATEIETNRSDKAAVSAPSESPEVAPPVSAIVTAEPTAGPPDGSQTAEPAVSEDEAAVAPAGPVQHVVKGVVTQWAPMVLFVQPGDQIVFRQMTGHDAETIEGMIPEGAETWQSKLGQEGFAVTLEVPGVYIYKCNPHVSLGMIGAIVVGDSPPANLGSIEVHPQNKGMIGRAIRKLKQALEAQGGT